MWASVCGSPFHRKCHPHIKILLSWPRGWPALHYPAPLDRVRINLRETIFPARDALAKSAAAIQHNLLQLNQDANSHILEREQVAAPCEFIFFFISFPSPIRLGVSCRRRIWLRRPRRAKLQTRTGDLFGVVSSSTLPEQSVPCGAKSDARPFRVWPHAWLLRIRYNSIKGLNLSRGRSCLETSKYAKKNCCVPSCLVKCVRVVLVVLWENRKQFGKEQPWSTI